MYVFLGSSTAIVVIMPQGTSNRFYKYRSISDGILFAVIFQVHSHNPDAFPAHWRVHYRVYGDMCMWDYIVVHDHSQVCISDELTCPWSERSKCSSVGLLLSNNRTEPPSLEVCSCLGARLYRPHLYFLQDL